ncbi:MAG: thermonuclease family protein [Candidatus Omnitrophica bacterium]|nr:thermonuclease family protein [Candidatus Omnitrophota bacterium]
MKRRSAVPSSASAAAQRRLLRHSVTALVVGTAAILAAVGRGAGHAARATPSEVIVRRVIDGDTIELSDGRLIRYIGIDTPEVRRRRGDHWVEDPEPFGREAAERNRQLVEGKRVRLEFDVETHDRYGRWLAYVYLVEPSGSGEPTRELLVNAQLVREGFAQPMTIPPNVAHAEEFRALSREARDGRRGLWQLR